MAREIIAHLSPNNRNYAATKWNSVPMMRAGALESNSIISAVV